MNTSSIIINITAVLRFYPKQLSAPNGCKRSAILVMCFVGISCSRVCCTVVRRQTVLRNTQRYTELIIQFGALQIYLQH